MIKFREYKSVKMLCMFLAGLMLYTSCNPDSLPVMEGCTQISFEHLDNEQIANHFELMLDFARSVDQQEEYTTLGEFHKELYGESEEATKYVETFNVEEQKYLKMGFEGYVESSETISNGLKEYFINYSQRLTAFLTNDRPDLEQFTQFVNQQKSEALGSTLCANDQDLMQTYLSATQGYGNWYYKHYFDASATDADLRGCNFWKGLLCGLLALVVGLVVAVVATAVLLVANIFVDGQQVQGQAADDLAILAGLALGIYVGVNIYQWCCKKNEIEEQPCLAPTGSSYIETGCNSFRYRVFGPSNYANTSWTNTNATPASSMTTTPRITVGVPSFGDPTTMTANIACVTNASNVTIFPWAETLTFESSEDLFPVEWTIAPPTSYTWIDDSNVPTGDLGFENIIYAQVNTPGNNSVFSYDWSINSQHTILSGGGSSNNFINIQVAGPNVQMLITTVTVTNNCTGETDSITRTTFIN